MAYLAGMGAAPYGIMAVEVSADEDAAEIGKRVNEALPKKGVEGSGRGTVDSDR